MKKLLARLVLIISPFIIAYNIWSVVTDRWYNHIDIAVVAVTFFLVFATIALIIQYRRAQ